MFSPPFQKNNENEFSSHLGHSLIQPKWRRTSIINMIKAYIKNIYSTLSEHTDEQIVLELEKRLTVKHPNYWFSPKYKAGLWDGGHHFLKIPSLKFPTGLLFIIKEYCEETDTKYEIIDLRGKKPHDIFTLVGKSFLKDIELYDYQLVAINRAIAAERGILELPTGSGKTEIAAAIIKALGLKTLFMVHTKDLLHQTIERFKLRLERDDIGIVGDSNWDTASDIVVGTIQTLYRRLFPEKPEKGKRPKADGKMKEFLNQFQVMFQDECLSGDSFISLPNNEIIAIREIYENPFITEVMSYNEEKQILEPKKIVRKIKIPLVGKMFKKFQFFTNKENFLKITDNHKIWTNQGYKQLKDLTGKEILKAFEIGNKRKVYICKLCGKKFYDRELYRNHNSFACPIFFKKAMETRSKNLKYRKYLSDRMISNNPMDNPQTIEKMVQSMQPYYKKTKKERTRRFQLAPLYKKGKRHKVTSFEQKILDMNISGVEYTGDGKIYFQFSNKLKNPDFIIEGQKKVIEVGDTEYWHSLNEIRKVKEEYKKIGIECLYLINEDFENLKETRKKIETFIINHKVLDFSIVKKSSPQLRYKRTKKHRDNISEIKKNWWRLKKQNRLPKEQKIKRTLAWSYNLEIEDNHNYIANGLLVSNCHHASSATMFAVGMFMHNAHYRFGISGTALRRDILSNMKVMALTGKTIYKLPTRELIDDGVLSDIEVRILENSVPAFGSTWQQVYEAGIVRAELRNIRICECAYQALKEDKKVMVLVRQIEHGKILQRMLVNKMHVPTVFIYGRHESWERARIKHDFNQKGGFILITSSIFSEGVDIPEINVLIIAAGGKSEVLTIQRVGRGLRKKKDKSKLIVYDFDDHASKYLNKHSKERIKIYRVEGFLK